MSLNSQYLVVFNNPRDQQQITVLARQMYPGQSEKFLNTYRMATSKPFGYLLIDLKPDTLNDKRLWPNVFQQTNKLPTAEQPYFYYSEQKAGGSSEEQTEPRSHLNFRNPEPAQPLVDLKTYNRGVPPPHFQFSKEPLNVEDMASIMARASCDECGVLFETLSDLQNHVRHWCYGGSDTGAVTMVNCTFLESILTCRCYIHGPMQRAQNNVNCKAVQLLLKFMQIFVMW